MTNDFWGKVELEEDGNFDADGGGFAPLPENTEVLAMISQAGVESYEGEEKIKIVWDVLKPEEHKNRKIFQNVKVYDTDQSKADKARKMLGMIDMNAGGGLMASGQAPNDMNLMTHLSNKMMFLKLGVWEMNGKDGNWVKAVGPKSRYGQEPIQAPTKGAEDQIDF